MDNASRFACFGALRHGEAMAGAAGVTSGAWL
jgi:hypothetical protein